MFMNNFRQEDHTTIQKQDIDMYGMGGGGETGMGSPREGSGHCTVSSIIYEVGKKFFLAK
jgi:hypothetical protein